MLGVNCETSDRHEKLIYNSNKNDINKRDMSAFYSISHFFSSVEKGILCFILCSQNYLLIDIISSRLVDSPLSSNKKGFE